jgi:hypothetical protein
MSNILNLIKVMFKAERWNIRIEGGERRVYTPSLQQSN